MVNNFETFKNGVVEGKYVLNNFFSNDRENKSYMNKWFDLTFENCNPTPEFKKGFMSVFGF